MSLNKQEYYKITFYSILDGCRYNYMNSSFSKESAEREIEVLERSVEKFKRDNNLTDEQIIQQIQIKTWSRITTTMIGRDFKIEPIL